MGKLNNESTVTNVEQLVSKLKDALECAESLLKKMSVEGISEKPKAEPKKEVKKCTFEELRALLAAKSRAGFTADVKVLINKYGGAKLSDIDEANYQDLYEEAERLNNE